MNQFHSSANSLVIQVREKKNEREREREREGGGEERGERVDESMCTRANPCV